MKPKPVRKYAPPKYPTHLEIAARPALLHRHQPPAWRRWPELSGAACLFLLADAARLPAADGPPNGSQNAAQAQSLAVVAPIFQHGEGRGATGCIVMSPPVFLSEEAALQVIREEMAAKGVQLRTNQTTLAGVTVESRWKPGVGTQQQPFKADAADPKKKVFVEFLSGPDARRWDWERDKEAAAAQATNSPSTAYIPVLSTVDSYDLPQTAAYVVKRVKQQATHKVYFGTFYDPIAGTWNSRIDVRAESRRLLRLQVQDFLKWLQAQGAI
jgi:hypothetical protein